MAQIQTSEGVPSVKPGGLPDDYQHISANPAEFGAGIGQGLQGVGAGAQKAGEIFGQIQTDDAINGTLDQVNGVLEKYRGLEGREALDARAETESKIRDIFEQGKKGLLRADQQHAYDQTTRNYQQRYVSGIISSHADQQAKTYAKSVNESAFQVALTNIANVADDDEHVESFVHDAADAAVKQVQAEGNGADHDAVTNAVNRAYRTAYKTQIETVGVKDPARAVALTEKHKDILGLDYASLNASMRTRANEQAGLSVANDAFALTAHQLQNAEPAQQNLSAVNEALWTQESGNKDNAPTSVNGAIGPTQMTPATFARFKQRPDADINNPTDNRAASAAYVKYLSELPSVQGDPSRIAVGYFSGEGNIAPIGSQTPWIKDAVDGNGKSTSSYVGDVTQRLGSHGPILAARAAVYDNILAATEGNPQVRQIALREVQNRYQAAEIADLQDQKAKAAAQDATLRHYGDSFRAGQPDYSYRTNPNLTETQVEHLEDLAKKTIKEAMDGGPGDWGPGYADIQKRIFSTGDGRIVNQEQLLAEVNKGNLTPSGYVQASQWLEKVKKPENMGERIQAEHFYKSVEQAVTHLNEMTKAQIPGSSEKLNRALPVINQALEAGRAKGLTDAQMMNPDSKDSVWPLLKPYLPSDAQVNAYNLTNDVHVEAPQYDMTTQAGLQEALKAGKISRADAIKKALDLGFIRQTGPAGPQVPTTSYEGPNVSDLAAKPGSEGTDPAAWDKRSDGSNKGNGFLGLLRRPDGSVSSELSVGVDIGGKEVEIPTLVPTLTRREVETMLALKPGEKVPQEIVEKAARFAQNRIAAGKSPFASPEESPRWDVPNG